MRILVVVVFLASSRRRYCWVFMAAEYVLCCVHGGGEREKMPADMRVHAILPGGLDVQKPAHSCTYGSVCVWVLYIYMVCRCVYNLKREPCCTPSDRPNGRNNGVRHVVQLQSLMQY